MKKLAVALMFISGVAFSQAYKGKEDLKLSIGAHLQDGGTGISATLDKGIGQNMSFGLQANYMLNANKIADVKAKFEDRADLRLRFNANIGDVIGLEENMDVFPGLHIGTRNFGAHLGFRYFFTDGFGVFTEAALPIAQYDSDVVGFENYNNQFVFQIGATFNL